VGGLSEKDTLLNGPVTAVAAQVADTICQSDGTGVIVAPGCVLPLAVPDGSLEAVVSGVRGTRP
jgi:uroporphyrinogen decarboxylase